MVVIFHIINIKFIYTCLKIKTKKLNKLIFIKFTVYYINYFDALHKENEAHKI
jgi:hypothetical protein